jgi:hypothetical protein
MKHVHRRVELRAVIRDEDDHRVSQGPGCVRELRHELCGLLQRHDDLKAVQQQVVVVLLRRRVRPRDAVRAHAGAEQQARRVDDAVAGGQRPQCTAHDDLHSVDTRTGHQRCRTQRSHPRHAAACSHTHTCGPTLATGAQSMSQNRCTTSGAALTAGGGEGDGAARTHAEPTRRGAVSQSAARQQPLVMRCARPDNTGDSGDVAHGA